ncbi:MAG: hypothetical protein PUG71_00760 [bacterium]|nr:hypothetical protein [bacterium]
MKRAFLIFLVVLIALGTVGCSAKKDQETVGKVLLEDFKSNPDRNVQEIADRIINNEIIPFAGSVMEVEPGFLTGFDNAEITGFKEGAMFSPMIGTIPFVGYIFEVEDDTDVDSFIETLKDHANLRWNICTEAEELTLGKEGNKVFFLMSPMSFKETAE